MRLTEASGAGRRRDLEIVGDFPALPQCPEKPEVVSQAAVFRIYPNQTQERAFRQWAGAGRWFWNKCVEINQQLYAREGRFAFHGELTKLLPEIKAVDGWEWLKEPPAIHLVDVSRRFDKALKDFLEDRKAVRNGNKSAAKAKDFPKFKSKRDRDVSIYLPGSALKLIRREAAPDKARGWVELPGMDETEVRVPTGRGRKIEWKRAYLRRAIRVRGGRWPEGTIRSATIKREGGAWFLSVQFDGPPPKKVKREPAPVPTDKPVHPDPTADNGPAADPDAGPETAAVGYDAGLKHLLVGSDGTHVPVGRNLRKAEKKLKREQRAASRRTRRRVEREKREGRKLPRSSGERKAHARVAATHRQVRRRRSDLLHQTSHRATADMQSMAGGHLGGGRLRGGPERRGHGPEQASRQVRGRRGPGRVAAPVGIQEPLARTALRQDRPVRRQHADLFGVRAPARRRDEAEPVRPPLDLSVLRGGP